MVPADAPTPSLGLSTQSTGSQSSPGGLDARQESQTQLALLRAGARQQGLLLIAEWLRRTEHQLIAAARLVCVSDTPSNPAAPHVCPPRARTRRKHSERLALAGD